MFRIGDVVRHKDNREAFQIEREEGGFVYINWLRYANVDNESPIPGKTKDQYSHTSLEQLWSGMRDTYIVDESVRIANILKHYETTEDR